jgi:small subunit ribosomal protein S8
MYTDPIADMLTRIRNANTALHPETKMPSSKLKEEIARILSEEGYIDGWKTDQGEVGTELVVRLRYGSDRKRVLQGILSTSEGVMTDRDARRRNVGGEVLCRVW